MPPGNRLPLQGLNDEIATCGLCPRLVEWREAVAAEKRASFREQDYWGRGVPGFGDPEARIVVVGLAPAAHGANRTGRVFTGDRSGDFLFAAMHRCGLANQPTSTDVADGLELRDAYVSAAVRCAPPANKPTSEERDNCRPFLLRELAILEGATVVVALGRFAYEAFCGAVLSSGVERHGPRVDFAHLAEQGIGRFRVIASFHPSQQNTFTGRLTESMLDAVFTRAVQLASANVSATM